MRVNINITNQERKKEDLNTKVTPEVQKAYLAMCKDRNLVTKPIANEQRGLERTLNA